MQESDEHIELEEPDVPEYYETEKILRWRWATHPRHRRRCSREFLVLWRGYPLEEASWIPEENFRDKQLLEAELQEFKPEEEI